VGSDEIGELAGKLGAELPTETDGNESFRFSAFSLPELPQRLRTDQLVMRSGSRIVNGCWRTDSLDVFANRRALQGLGLVVMSALFYPPDVSIEVELTNAGSDVRLIRVYGPATGPDLVMRATSFKYWPTEPARHPWVTERPPPEDLPSFRLTTDDELGGTTADEWAKRDTVVGFGQAGAVVRIGSLLLDLGNPACRADEAQLEVETGFRGLGYERAEVRFSLRATVATSGSVSVSQRWSSSPPAAR
jgi:hypothetical protein